ncbi:MAG: NAD-dependent epimerase/dehydratase family protein [Candidatus ainarchaeum sp.]|nr:NAD-dependent epimerase/dehydratase family protein [Candidatus ainarchaeum sp.]
MAGVLVTGGAGFIGSTVASALARGGEEVSVLDDFSLGREYELSEVKGKVKIFKGDITKPAEVEKAFAGVGQVYHFASASSAPMYEPDPRKATEATLNGFLNVLEEARKRDVSRIVFASSSSVYGANPTPHSEGQRIAPLSFYVAAKLAKENYAEVYSKMYGMRIAAMRFFSVYGEREKHKGRYANVITQFLWKMKAGGRPVIYGDGSQTRDYVYAGDVARACMLAMGKGASGVFNVGTGKAHSFNQIVEMLNARLGTGVKPVYAENPIKNYVAHTLADTRKAEKELGFKAECGLEEGIAKLANHY